MYCKNNVVMSNMILKFIFVLYLFFPVSKSLSILKTENTSAVIKKVLPLIDETVSGTLKINGDDKVLFISPKTIENVFDCSSDSLNTSSNCTEAPPKMHFVSKNIDPEKENETELLHEHPALVEVISTKAENISLHGLPVNQTIGKHHQLVSIKSDAVNQLRDENSGTSNSSTRYTKMTGARFTKAYVMQRMARAKTESVQSALKKIFPDTFFSKEHNSDSDRSREKYGNPNSSRRQKLKKLGTGRLDGEAVYFREGGENTSPAGGTETSPTGGAATSPAGGAETTPTGGAETSSTGGAATSPAGGAETTPTGGAATSPAGGAETTTAGGAETTTAGGAGTSPTGGESTGGPLPPGQTGTEKNQGNTATSVGQMLNYHYHFHYFGGIPPPTMPGETTTKAT